MGKGISTAPKTEKAVLVGLVTPDQSEQLLDEYLDELDFLANTAGIVSEKRFTQNRQHPDVAHFIGKGKLNEIKEYIEKHNIDVVIFDDDLTPSQLRNVERKLEKKIYDRSLLILDIFQLRAKSAQAKTQVELARYEYLLPRLTRMWTHLERQRGGTSTRGGAGEKEIETDRRIIRDKISRLKKKLQQIEKQSAVQRSNRGQLVRVALVGYTNVGKSTLMNILSKSEVFAEDKLFATLDTTVRKVTLWNLPFLLTDTVGFIRKLPHSLVESFKSTLDETREADVLVHVVDISHPNFEDQYEVVNKTLGEIGASNKETIVVFNKIDKFREQNKDQLEEHTQWTLDELSQTWMSKLDDKKCIFISALQKENLQELRQELYDTVKEIFKVRYPYNNFLY